MADWYEILSGVSGLGTGLMAGQAGAAAERRKREEAEATQGRLFEHQTGLQRLRGQQAMEELKAREVEQEKQAIRAEERTRAAKLKPFGALPPVLQQYFEQPPSEQSLVDYSIGATQERPRVQAPETVDIDVLTRMAPIISQREKAGQEEMAASRAQRMIESLRGGGVDLAPGTDVTVPMGGGARITQRGPLREPVAIGDASSFLQTHRNHAKQQGMSPLEAEQWARSRWQDEAYRGQWMRQYGTKQGQFAAETGAGPAFGAGGVVPGAAPGPGAAAPASVGPSAGAPGETPIERSKRLAAQGTTAGGPGPVEAQNKIAAGLNVVRNMNQFLETHGKAIERYGSSVSMASAEGRDILAGWTKGAVPADERYINFRQKLREIELLAFDYGGKQLTDTEKAFVLAAVPSQNWLAGARTPQELRSRLEHTRQRFEYLTQVQGRYVALTRGQYEAAVGADLAQFAAPTSGGAPVPSGAPASGYTLERVD